MLIEVRNTHNEKILINENYIMLIEDSGQRSIITMACGRKIIVEKEMEYKITRLIKTE